MRINKNSITTLSLVLVSFLCYSQNQVRITVASQNGQTAYCGFSTDYGFSSVHQASYIVEEAHLGHSTGIPDAIETIIDVSGFDFEIRVFIAAEEQNCFATIGEGGVRAIIADFDFLIDVNEHADTDWAAISILAHEVGHHIAGFNRSPDQRINELDADYWSGYILKKLGASRTAAVKCIQKYGTDFDTNSHPSKQRRVAMIQKGWDDAVNGDIDYSHCKDCSQN